MSDTLIITNGDSAVDVLRAGGLEGTILPWRDVLHDGPVPDGLDLEELSSVRAEFIAAMGWSDHDSVARSFRERDGLLADFRRFRRVTLWFEHDLYDQLQILQILHWFSGQEVIEPLLCLMCSDSYLGLIEPEDVKILTALEQPVSAQQLSLARIAWEAFRSQDPVAFRDLLDTDLSALPFLKKAVFRQLQEYPDSTTGLSRTQTVILRLLRDEPRHGGRLFGDYQRTEEARFMGDLSFWLVLDELLNSDQPLVALANGEKRYDPRNRADVFQLTDAGRQVLSAESFWLDKHAIDRWIGGVHLEPGNYWLFDGITRTMIPHKR